MLSKEEAASLKAALKFSTHGSHKDPVELARLQRAIDRETMPDALLPPALGRTRTRDGFVEQPTAPIPIETMAQIVERGRKPTGDFK